jgi:hypothetical protein
MRKLQAQNTAEPDHHLKVSDSLRQVRLSLENDQLHPVAQLM